VPEAGRSAEELWAVELRRAGDLLRGGGVVGYPSETVWGLAALPTLQSAVERLYQIKGRDAAKPVQLSVTVGQVQRWLRPAQQEVQKLARFWPGPLTVLAWAAPDVPEWLAPGGVIGLRVPASAVAQALLTQAGGALATTSLNPSGRPAAMSFEQAQQYGLADLLLPESPADKELADEVVSASGTSGLASTVFDVRTRRVLRAGAISEAELLAVLV
jgi:L-threonylcarbamoyladenylate synthase